MPIVSGSISSGDSAVSGSGQRSGALLVLGGGILGLWGAVKAAQAGFEVTLVDRGAIGSGASGGLMGAMFPWMPDRWDDKKQFQFDALTSLPAELAALEARTGLTCGYSRAGRIIPLPKPHLRTIALRHQADALRNWHRSGHAFDWHVLDAPPVADYLDPQSGAAGWVHDTLAARAEPRPLIRLLRAWLQDRSNVRLVEQVGQVVIDAARGEARLSGREETVAFTHAFIAAGVESFPMLEALLPPLPKPLGQGVKGQAALLQADLDPSLPVAFLDGLYIVPHAGGHVAVGSTSENTYADPASTDDLLDVVLDRARALVPALRHATVLERWAGLRPKAVGRDPLVGPLPDHANIIALTGGFKISFGMAHRLAACAVDYALGREPSGLPTNFTLAGQISREMANVDGRQAEARGESL